MLIYDNNNNIIPNLNHVFIFKIKEAMIAVAKESVASSKDLCAAAFRCGHAQNSIFNWTIQMPDVPKPPVLPPKPPKVTKKH